MSTEEDEFLLYKWNSGWGLPSIDPASTQAEVYLRLARVPLTIQECNNARSGPTGTCPALEHRGELVAASASSSSTPADAATAIIAHARASDPSGKYDLDASLTKADAAEAAAWRALTAAALEPASSFVTWCDQSAYDEFTKKAFGEGLPFPLDRLIPRTTRKAVASRFSSGGGGDASSVRERVLSDAVAAHAAVAARLGASKGPFFFGDRPSSVDALLFAHLSFHSAAPVSPPELRESARCRPEVARYLARVAEAAGLAGDEDGSAACASPAPYLSGSGWEAAAPAAARAARAASPNDFLWGSARVPGGGKNKSEGRDGGEGSKGGGGSRWWPPFGRRRASDAGGGAAARRDLSHRRGNLLWVASVTALVLGYVALSGQYFTIEWEELDELEGLGEGGDVVLGGDGGDGGE